MPKKQYTWNPLTDSVIEETDGAGNVLVEYVNEPSAYGPLLSQHKPGEDRHFHFDALGSTRALSDDEGNVTDTFAYEAWGNIVQRIGSTPLRFLWNGRWGYIGTNTTKHYYVRLRTYCSIAGRWISADPFDISIAGHVYTYGLSSPADSVDPSGMIAVTITPADVCEASQSSNPACTPSVHPYSYANLNRFPMNPSVPPRLGETPARASFNCLCKNNGYHVFTLYGQCACYSLECSATLHTEIRIDPWAVQAWGGPLTGITVSTVYGHEQAHVRCFREKFHEIVAYMRAREESYCGDLDGCLDDALTIIGRARGLWDMWHHEEVYHRNSCSPQSGQPVEPWGGMPLPSNSP